MTLGMMLSMDDKKPYCKESLGNMASMTNF